MRGITRRPSRPSPALVVATIALIAALVGTATALPGRNSVDSGDIEPQAVKSSDIKNGKVKRKDHKPDQNTDWALIDASVGGGIISSSPGVSIAEVGAGYAYVDFGQDVSGRAIVASSKYPGGNDAVEVTLCGSTSNEDETCFSTGANNHNHVYFDVAGAQDVYLAVLPR